jgi:general secretion pathway protein D
MEDVEKWIGLLDKEGGKTARGLHIYRVKNGRVKDLAAIVEKLYPKKTSSLAGDKATQFKPSVGEYAKTAMGSVSQTQPQYPSLAPAAAPAAAKQPAQSGDRGQGGEEASFDIIPNEELNSFIIRGSSSEYAEVLDILKTIDIYPQQVLLEVLVGEVSLDDTLALGVEWTYFKQSGQYQHTVSLSPVDAVAGNFRYLVEKTNVLSAAFNSLARSGKASILSSPNVIAANGKKSKINVVTQVPIVSSVLASNTNPPVTTTTTTYMDSGIMLDFTPYINDGGLVTLEVNLEVSEVGNAAPGQNPTFLRRNISTPIVASENQSIVLGGLVREQKSTAGSGIPFFYKIPLIGWLFGQRGDQVQRNELLFFITPRVIRSVEDGLALSRAVENRVNELKTRMREAEGIRLGDKDYRLPGRTPEERIPIAPGAAQ